MDGSPAPAEPLRGRRRFLIGVVTGAVVMAIAGLGASTLIKSPQQAAAEAAPPGPSLITATVERRVLRQAVVLRGTVEPDRALDVRPVPGAGRAVISRRTVKAGARVEAGTVLAEISGRPVIALKGVVPPYRDIHRGMKGSDVDQLQAALSGLGYRVTDRDGVFGASTERAIRKMYQARDYDPPVEEAEQPDPTAAPSASPTTAASRPAYLPMSEVYYVRSLPARVSAVKAGLGAEVRDAILTLSVGDMVVRGSLAPADRELVETGMPVQILNETTGRTVTGEVASIGDLRPGGGAEAGHPITVGATKALPSNFAGEDVRLTVTAATTGQAVLVVPVSAIFSAADGSTQVLRVPEGDRRRSVTVRTGASAGGFVEVSGDGLTEGDRVAVGGIPDGTG
ncbi:multidrug efflux pump subunit AcrA (membrane-fusion protein) [Actinoplanes campanulatus]|uniref:Multidrug efflux pump subunit AcrA (Membrane-fusion protein) n=1 Tax=Actinoplanes campanulatus TaxID=113559 RepID=A0A7W5ADE3_9ACTN|nr:peptidoglycan-binding protein [Actinoplanes campanulatus]MBB3094042.1 multidrug efflux pump subunit AcrA (membrane-fusion protein) [Actinoplanes campanulatus]GGN33123.1 peptidoglycan-binding protein [Actinoplanes campanulatus]GID38260.1 peptidoglycan-binding protein [Actinoplanes campanulatus]